VTTPTVGDAPEERAPSPRGGSRRPRPALALGVAVGYLVLATAIVDFWGLAGYRLGFLLTTGVLAGSVALLVALGGPIENRGLWAAALIAAGLALAALLVDRAPPSAGQLTRRLDGVELPLFAVTSHRRLGSSTCRPRCPAVERTYVAPATAAFAAVSRVVLGLRQAGLVADDVFRRDVRETTVRSRTPDGLIVEVRADPPEPGNRVEVVVTLTVP
jgi:hypothetical protein